MSDHGDWWARPSASSLYGEPQDDPWRATPPPPDPYRSPVLVSPALSPSTRKGGRRRVLLGVLAGATALAVALDAGTVLIDHHRQPFAPGRLLGGAPPAADTSAATGGGKPTPAPKPTQAPESVLGIAEVASRVNPGVVIINSELGYQNAEAAGTGMVLSATGEILTNNHVIDGATRITVTVVSSHRRYPADVVGTAPGSDVAVLQAEGASGLATIPIGDSDGITPGQAVVAIGNAGGQGSLSVVSGRVTATNRTITASDANGQGSERLTGMIEVQAPIKAGDSGGPLASRAGKVIGMDTAASTSRPLDLAAPTFGFAIPINRALTIAANVRTGGASRTPVSSRGYLGIQVRTADPVTNGGGAEVLLVTRDSPAAAAGLTSGDIITELNDRPVISADDLTSRLQQFKPGQQVTVGWIDPSGTVHSARVTLASGPAD